MNYQDMDAQSQQQDQQEVNSRAQELQSIFRKLILSVGKPLIFLNSSGTVALLIYIYLTSENLTSENLGMSYLTVSLFSFTFGIVATTTALMFLFMRTLKVESSYAVERDLFLNNQLSINELRANDSERCDSDYAEYILILLSFVALISGVLYGVFSFV